MVFKLYNMLCPFTQSAELNLSSTVDFTVALCYCTFKWFSDGLHIQ